MTPGEFLAYEEESHIVIEPIPSAEELHGIYSGGRDPDEVTERVRELREDEHQRAPE